MDSPQSCVNLKTIDNMAVFDALLGKPLNIETKLECKNTLARQAIEEVAPKTVRVTSPTAEGVLGGSGFFAGRNGDLVVTNVHVVANSTNTVIETVSGERFRAKIVDIDDVNDLAVLKIEGISKDPKRALELADDNKLKNGDPVLAIGHPAGSRQPVVSDGSFIAKLPQVLLVQPNIVNGMIENAAHFQVKEPAFAEDAKNNLFATMIGMDTPLWHGNSGGPVVNERNQLVGVSTAIDPANPYMSLAQPASNVKELLRRVEDKKEHKFDFTYLDQSAYDRDKKGVLTRSASEIVAGALLRRVAAPVWGGYSGMQAIGSLKMAAGDSFAGRGHYLAAAGEQLLGLAGGAMSLLPRTRTIGYGLAGASFALDLRHRFSADTALLKDVSRTSGEKRLPYGWGDKLF